MIDLRSDTVTRPSPGMREAMMRAEVGDDVFGEDPTVIALEARLAAMFGHEAGLFCASGTMTNQIAIRVHTRPGDEVICDEGAHVYRYEGGGTMANSGCSVRLLTGDRGRFSAQQVEQAIGNAADVHQARTRLVVVENTANRGGGSIWDLARVRSIAQLCRTRGLALHMDGARIFNAMVAAGEKPLDWGAPFDSVSICLSKGLGAPVGSVLTGSEPFIAEARRVRKRFGGGMRQAGILAAAGLYALDHNVERLTVDHERARALESALRELQFVHSVMPVQSNIVVFTLRDERPVPEFLADLKRNGILAVAFGPSMVRMVTHLDLTDEAVSQVIGTLQRLAASPAGARQPQAL